MINYRTIKDELDGHITIERKDADGTLHYFGEDEANPDYQQYLAWVSEQPTS